MGDTLDCVVADTLDIVERAAAVRCPFRCGDSLYSGEERTSLPPLYTTPYSGWRYTEYPYTGV